jgi:putative zinc finger protein
MTPLLVGPDNTMSDTPSSTHVTSDRLAAFLDGRLARADRDRAVRHFAECEECRRELAELRTILATVPVSRRRNWIAVTAGLAAVLAFAMVVRQRVSTPGDFGPPPPDAVRAGEVLPEIDVVAPVASEPVARSEMRLVWHSVGAGAQYSVVVQDTAGTEIWKATTADTSVVPDIARLEPGHRYFWNVDARLADGRTAGTRANRFRVR